VSECDYYEDAFDKSLSSDFDLTVINLCDVWAAQVDVTVENLLTWNPSLSKVDCILQPGKSYRILKCELGTFPLSAISQCFV
jgi:hypothetical protein